MLSSPERLALSFASKTESELTKRFGWSTLDILRTPDWLGMVLMFVFFLFCAINIFRYFVEIINFSSKAYLIRLRFHLIHTGLRNHRLTLIRFGLCCGLQEKCIVKSNKYRNWNLKLFLVIRKERDRIMPTKDYLRRGTLCMFEY